MENREKIVEFTQDIHKDIEAKPFTDFAEGLMYIDQDYDIFPLYKSFFSDIVQSSKPEEIYEQMNQKPSLFTYLSPMYLGSLIANKRFSEAYEYSQKLIEITYPFSFNPSKVLELLTNIDASSIENIHKPLDFCIGKIIYYYYLSIKFLGKDSSELYKHLVMHRTAKHHYTVSVLTNCILDYQINNDIYVDIEEKMSDSIEESKYYFYRGYIAMVKGEYKKALEFFNKADVLNKKKSTELKIVKCIIVIKLLQSDFSIFYPYQEELKPYFSLIGAIKRADENAFKRILDENKEEFFKLNIYFVIRRILMNVIQEGLRKISVCYSRIKIEDISKKLGFDVNFLLHKTIKNGNIKGYVENGVFYSTHRENPSIQIGYQIRKAINTRNSILSKMEYPPIMPLTFESEMRKNQSDFL